VTGDVSSLFDLRGRRAVVTGGASGIGRASAGLLAAAGASVTVCDLRAEAAEEAAAALRAEGAEAVAVALDVADPAAVEAAFAEIVGRTGGVDVLVNSAGISIRRNAFDLDPADWRRVMDVNVAGTFLCARAAARGMVERRSGAIVNVASIMGFSGGGIYPNPSYQASKGAVVNLTRALAVEWAPAGVRVNAVAPTWVRTAFIGELEANAPTMERIRGMTPLGRIAEAQEVAAAILFLASPAAAMTTGHILAVDGGYLAQ